MFCSAVDISLKSGVLLIAKPSLSDPNFSRSVVLLVSHDEQGTLGLVINRPTQISYREAFDEPALDIEGQLFHGGPVEGRRLFVLHRLGPGVADSRVVCDGIHFSGDIHAASERQGDAPKSPVFRGYLGCAGWATGQLEAEMQQDAWVLCPASARAVFDTEPDLLWAGLLRDMGGVYALYAMIPPDITLN